MNSLLQTILLLSGLYISEILNREQPMFIRYLCHFLVILGLLSGCKAYCCESSVMVFNERQISLLEIELESRMMDYWLAPQVKTKADAERLRDAHYVKGDAFRKAMKDKCWWLPDLEDRKVGRWCWTSFVGQIPCGTPQSKVISLLLSALAQYGLDCCNQWEEINNLGNNSYYHLAMFEFYADVVNNWK